MWAVTKWRTRSGFPELHPFPATTSHANIPRIPVFYIGVSCADYLHVVSVLRHHIESESKTRKKSSFGKYSTRRGMGPPLNCERMKVTHPGPADSTLIWVQERKPRARSHQSQHPRVCLRHFWSLSHSWNLLFFFFQISNLPHCCCCRKQHFLSLKSIRITCMSSQSWYLQI